MSDDERIKKPNKKAEEEADAGLKLDEYQENIDERLQEIEKKLTRIERESRVGIDDQLFFGLVLSFLLFFLAVPLPDVTNFLLASFKLDPGAASNVALGLKNAFVVFLLLSVVFRYYAAVKLAKGHRLWSILFLFIAFNLFVWNLVFAIGNPLVPPSGYTIENSFVSLSAAYIVLFVIYLLIGKLVESKILGFYAKKELISKKYVTPIASAFFICFLGTGGIVLLLEEVVFFGAKILFSQLILNVALFLSFLVCFSLYILFLRKRKVLDPSW
jgi:hypothetical protein